MNFFEATTKLVEMATRMGGKLNAHETFFALPDNRRVAGFGVVPGRRLGTYVIVSVMR